MKAIVLEKFGGVDNFVYKDIDRPIIRVNEVLIKVKAISINPVDIKVRSREAPLAEDLAHHNPLILGWDVSGEVTAVGSEVSKFQIGNEVFGMVNFVGMVKPMLSMLQLQQSIFQSNHTILPMLKLPQVP